MHIQHLKDYKSFIKICSPICSFKYAFVDSPHLLLITLGPDIKKWAHSENITPYYYFYDYIWEYIHQSIVTVYIRNVQTIDIYAEVTSI